MTHNDVMRLARNAGLKEVHATAKNTAAVRHGHEQGGYVKYYELDLKHFAALVIEDFLTRTGQYVTNDASREAAIKEAVEAEREACAKACEPLIKEPHGWNSFSYTMAVNDCTSAIRARGEKGAVA